MALQPTLFEYRVPRFVLDADLSADNQAFAETRCAVRKLSDDRYGDATPDPGWSGEIFIEVNATSPDMAKRALVKMLQNAIDELEK